MAGKKPLALRIEPVLLARVDVEAERLGQTRTKFVERALESALSRGSDAGTVTVYSGDPGGGGQAPSANASAEVPSASSRAPSHPATAREVQATRNIAEQTGVPERVPGCPECSGDMAPREGRWVCGDCGFTR